jgi:geranylgeranyl pyrophosphate synthase
VCDAAYKYGMHLGIAFQLVDDMLGARGMGRGDVMGDRRRKGGHVGSEGPDAAIAHPPPPPSPPLRADFDGTTASLGKPALADISSGLATAPVLYAAARFPALLPLVQRKFEMSGDVDAALQAVRAADGMALTRRLALAHGQLALDAIAGLADSPARTALAALVSKVLNRSR